VENRFADKPELVKELREIFEMADAVTYSGRTFSTERLQEWEMAIVGILKRLEKMG
jgi:hypothetical protein